MIHVIFVIILSGIACAQDWPMDRHDVYRSCSTSAAVTLPLHLQWVYQSRFAPAPAWPTEPDSTCFQLTQKGMIYPRRPFDWAFRVVSAGGKVFFGSSADEKVYCLDATTGRERWSFFADGPVRFAPTVSGNLVVFGTDGGSVFGLDTATGLKVWQYRPTPNLTRFQGNGRLISRRPVRTDVLVDSLTAYFGSGLDRVATGIYWSVINISTGTGTTSEAREDLGFTYEGYSWMDSGDQVQQTRGRSGWPSYPPSLSNLYAYPEYQGANIYAGSTRFNGLDSVLSGGNGAWEATLNGKVYSLAFANGLLFAGTSTGRIYCFGPTEKIMPDTVKSGTSTSFYENSALKAGYAAAAQAILSGSGAYRGYALVLGCGEGRLAYELAIQSGLNVVCLETDAGVAALARRRLDSCGLYGRVVIQEPVRPDSLPYPDFFFDIVTYDGYGTNSAFSGLMDEAMRVLAPCGGTAFLTPGYSLRRGPIAGAGEWTHNLANPANNPNSQDPYVALDMKLQWLGAPGPEHEGNHHSWPPAPEWKNGILMVPGENWLTAVGGYNGAILWEKAVPRFSRLCAPILQGGAMVLQDDYLYITSGGQCLRLTPRTGEEHPAFPVPDFGGKSYFWGYIAVVDDGPDSLLFGSAMHPDAVLAPEYLRDGFWKKGTGVCERLFALDRHTGALKWSYAPDSGLILSTTITAADGKIAFLESTDGNTSGAKYVRLSPLLGNGRSALTALDMKTGNRQWRRTLDVSRDSIWISMLSSSGRLILEGTRSQSPVATDIDTAVYDFHLFDMADGDSLLVTSVKAGDESHGNFNSHAVVIGDSLYIKSHYQPVIVDLRTGVSTRVAMGEYGPNAHKCGIFSASRTTLYYRGAPGTCCISAPSGWSVEGGWGVYSAQKARSFTHTSKPGCRINMIPAGGLLSIPEGTSDCFCKFALQTSICFLSAQKGLETPLENAEARPGRGASNPLFACSAPNPYNTATTISFYAGPSGNYTLKVYDICGRLIRRLASGKAGPALRHAIWDSLDDQGRGVGTGMYYYRLACGGKSVMGRLVLVK